MASCPWSRTRLSAALWWANRLSICVLSFSIHQSRNLVCYSGGSWESISPPAVPSERLRVSSSTSPGHLQQGALEQGGLGWNPLYVLRFDSHCASPGRLFQEERVARVYGVSQKERERRCPQWQDCLPLHGASSCVWKTLVSLSNKKIQFPSDQRALILALLSLFFSMTLLSLVNPLEQQEDDWVQKTHLTSELLEANALQF